MRKTKENRNTGGRPPSKSENPKRLRIEDMLDLLESIEGTRISSSVLRIGLKKAHIKLGADHKVDVSEVLAWRTRVMDERRQRSADSARGSGSAKERLLEAQIELAHIKRDTLLERLVTIEQVREAIAELADIYVGGYQLAESALESRVTDGKLINAIHGIFDQARRQTQEAVARWSATPDVQTEVDA